MIALAPTGASAFVQTSPEHDLFSLPTRTCAAPSRAPAPDRRFIFYKEKIHE
jgi:hypothetical protein